MAVSLWMAVGAMWAGSTLCWAWPSPGKGPCPHRASEPLQLLSLSPVWRGDSPRYRVLRSDGGREVGPFQEERRWLRGHGKQVSEAGGRHQSCLSSGLRCPGGRGEGCPAPEDRSWLLVLMSAKPECSIHPVHSRTSSKTHLVARQHLLSQLSSWCILDQPQSQPVLELGTGH
uniref:Uncharacterized protein n=1 Tax=Rousettus aegyptiacus TaxID=9407 RepID=A0A7J8CIE0_ROUAE|nr:hypothetical protein HJG63_009115 [Rousettus aegyptiacus]